MDDNTNRLVGNNLRRERWIRDWSQAFVARQLDISIRTLSRAETGCGISKKILKKLCCLYQIPLAKLYDEKENIQEYFSASVQEAYKASSTPHDERVVNTISKLFFE